MGLRSIEVPIEIFKELIAMGFKYFSLKLLTDEAAFLFEKGSPFSLTSMGWCPNIGTGLSRALNISTCIAEFVT